MADTPKRRARRQFTDEFKAGVVRLVLDERKTVGAVARDMDLTEPAVREWVKRADPVELLGVYNESLPRLDRLGENDRRQIWESWLEGYRRANPVYDSQGRSYEQRVSERACSRYLRRGQLAGSALGDRVLGEEDVKFEDDGKRGVLWFDR